MKDYWNQVISLLSNTASIRDVILFKSSEYKLTKLSTSMTACVLFSLKTFFRF